jgi:hypothetical protein
MRIHEFLGVVTTAVTAFLGGCASTSLARTEPATGTSAARAIEPGAGMMSAMCPMDVPGAAVTPTDVNGGVALVFTTGAGDVAELRQRVRSMAEMHNRHHAGGMMMGGRGAGGGRGGMMGGGMRMPAASASVEDVEGGARLVLRPRDPAQLGALREHVRMQAGRMAHGECPMMSPGAVGTSEPPAPPTQRDGGHEAHHPAPPGG